MTMQSNSEFETLLNYTQKDIQFAKHKQWTIPYYVLLVFGGVFALTLNENGKQFLDNPIFWQTLILAIFSFLLFAHWHLIKIQANLVGYRKRLQKILQEKPTGLAYNILGEGVLKKGYKSFYRDWIFLIGFNLVLGAAFLFLLYPLHERAGCVESLKLSLFFFSTADVLIFIMIAVYYYCQMKCSSMK
jgi:protein-S-isoprenylcysteine O-methyltransferase Ste14